MESVTQSELESFLESEMDSRAESEIYTLEGVKFDPTDEEYIRLLEHKAWHPDFDYPPIYQAKIYEFEPYQLPGLPAIQTDGNLYFFCKLIPFNASSERYRRYTETGYWKKTGKTVKIKDKRTHEEIGERRTLVFHIRFRGCAEEVGTNWKMYEYSAYANNNNPDFKDLVICRIKEDEEKQKKEDKKRCISTKNENERSKKRLNSTNDGFQPEPQLPSSCHSISDPRSDSVGFTNPEWHYHSVANVNNHAVEDTSMVDPLPLENLNVLNGSTRLNQISFSMRLSPTTDGFQPEPQLSPSCYLISDPRSDAVGNTNPEWHYYSVSNVNNHAVEDTSLVDSLPLEDLNVLNGSIRLDQTLFSMQSPILPEPGASSSSVFINENEILNSSYGIENQGEDYLQEEWLWVALDEYPNEETRHTRGFCGGDNSDVGTEIFNTREDEAFWNNTLEHV